MLYAEVFRPFLVLEKGTHVGFQWIIIRNHMNCRCGYVCVGKNHPWFGKSYTEMPDDIVVHGGLTFSEHGYTKDSKTNPEEWWVGFDCGHLTDCPDPILLAYGSLFCLERDNTIYSLDRYGVVRTQEYVKQECENLCKQAKAALESQTGYGTSG